MAESLGELSTQMFALMNERSLTSRAHSVVEGDRAWEQMSAISVKTCQSTIGRVIDLSLF